jgi:hypothetical protein
VIALLAEDEPQSLEVVFVELAITTLTPPRGEEALGFEKADLGDRDVGVVLTEEVDDLADRE